MKNKLGFSAGILNLVLGGILFLTAIVVGIAGVIFLLLCLSPVAIIAIPATICSLIVLTISMGSAISNTVTGTGAVVSAIKGGTLSKIFSVSSITVDILVMPALVAWFVLVLLSSIQEETLTDALFIVELSMTFISVCLAITSLCIHSVYLARKMRDNVANNPEQTIEV